MKENKKLYQTINQIEANHLLTKSSDKIMVFVFSSDWSGSASMLDDIYEQIAQEFKEKAAFYRLNADNSERLMAELNIQSTPTSVFFQDGQVIDLFEGLMAKSKIRGRIKSLATSNNEVSVAKH